MERSEGTTQIAVKAVVKRDPLSGVIECGFELQREADDGRAAPLELEGAAVGAHERAERLQHAIAGRE